MIDSLIPDVSYNSSVTAPFQTSNLVKGTGKTVQAISTDFEAVFISQMLGQMFSGDELTSFFGGGTAGEIYKGFMLDEYGKSMAKAGGIGIAEQIKTELLKLQETSHDTGKPNNS